MDTEIQYEFKARDDSELSCPRGATLKIFSYTDDKDWCEAEYRGRRGLVPASYLTFDNKSPWFKGFIGRKAAEAELSTKSNGEYLVRVSESAPDSFSLSVKCRKGIQHYKIYNTDGRYRLWSQEFDTINALLHYHHSTSVSQTDTILLQDIKIQDIPKLKTLYDFSPTSEDEIKLRRGDILEVVDQSDPNWWEVRNTNTGETGLVPSNYVEAI